MALVIKKLKSSLPFVILILFISAIALLMVLDYFDIESFKYFNDRGFYFDYTWKGRLFLLFFLWLFVLEFMNMKRPSEEDLEITPKAQLRVILALVFAAIPLIYVISANFLGLSQTVLDVGDALVGDYFREIYEDWQFKLQVDWVLIFEYLMFTFAFLASALLAYGKKALRNFSITLGLIAGICGVYMLDTFFPSGTFRPFQLMTLPTAAFAAAFLEILGYRFAFNYIPGGDSGPSIRLYTQPNADGVSHLIGGATVAWPCAGVHSLFLYTLIALLLFKKSEITRFRKLAYFVIGAIGTYLFNILRIVTYFVILEGSGREAAQTFHDVYGELYSVIWILVYMLLVISIERFGLIDKTMQKLGALRDSLPIIGKKGSVASEEE